MAKSAKYSTPDNAIYFVGLLAWLIPGGGHWLLGMRDRALIIFFAITSTFIFGLALGSIEVIDPQNSKAWFLAQILTGLPTIIVTFLQNNSVGVMQTLDTSGNAIFGRGVDLAQVYTGIAGLLNLLCVVDALFRAQIKLVAQHPKIKKRG